MVEVEVEVVVEVEGEVVVEVEVVVGSIVGVGDGGGGRGLSKTQSPVGPQIRQGPHYPRLTWATGPISWHTSGTAGKHALGCTGTGRGILRFRLAHPANARFVNAVLGRVQACDRVAATGTAYT